MAIGDFFRNVLAPIGSKLAGGIAAIGSKVSNIGNSILNGIDSVPILGQLARPFTTVGRGALGVVDSVANVADKSKRFLDNPSTERFGDIVGAATTVAKSGKGAYDTFQANKSGMANAKRASSGLLREKVQALGI